MSREIDSKVVGMYLNNRDFEEKAKTTLSTLQKLKDSLNMDNAADSFSVLQQAIDSVNLNGLLKNSFATIEKFTQLHHLVDSFLSKVRTAITSMSTDQIMAGWDKYEKKTEAIQTIMSATAKDYEDQEKQMEDVTRVMEQLNWFTDETSYSLTDMTTNIGKFTSNGVKLDTAVTSMQGISTWAATAGAKVAEAGRTMYNLSQALAVGSVKLIDWKSVENAGMATREFKEQVIETAVAMGTLKKAEDGTFYSNDNKEHVVSATNFNEYLKDEWFSADVLNSVLSRYGTFANDLKKFIDDLGDEADYTASDIIGYIDTFKEGGEKAQEVVSEIAEATGQDAKWIHKTLESMSSDANALGVKAFKAAQEAKTLSDVLDATKDAVSTGWMNTFEAIFGNYLEAKVVFTDMANAMWDLFAAGGERRNKILKAWSKTAVEGYGEIKTQRELLLAGFGNIWNTLMHVVESVRSIRYEITKVKDATNGLIKFTESFYKGTSKILEFVQQFQATKEFAQEIKTIIGNLATTVRGSLLPAIAAIYKFKPELLTKAIKLVTKNKFTKAAAIIAAVIKVISINSDAVAQTIKSVVNVTIKLLDIVAKISAFVSKIVGWLVDKLAIGPLSFILKTALSIVGALVKLIDKFVTKISSIRAPKWLESFTQIPKMASSLTTWQKKNTKSMEAVGGTLGAYAKTFFDSVQHGANILSATALVVRQIPVPEWLKPVRDLAAKGLEKLASGITNLISKIRGWKLPAWMQTAIDILKVGIGGSLFGDEVVEETEADAQKVTKSFKSVKDMVLEVIRGDWKNGLERDSLLESAGFNNDLIQSVVNQVWSLAGDWKEGYQEILDSYAETNAYLETANDESAEATGEAAAKPAKTLVDWIKTFRDMAVPAITTFFKELAGKIATGAITLSIKAVILWQTINTKMGAIITSIIDIVEKIGNGIKRLKKYLFGDKDTTKVIETTVNTVHAVVDMDGELALVQNVKGKIKGSKMGLIDKLIAFYNKIKSFAIEKFTGILTKLKSAVKSAGQLLDIVKASFSSDKQTVLDKFSKLDSGKVGKVFDFVQKMKGVASSVKGFPAKAFDGIKNFLTSAAEVGKTGYKNASGFFTGTVIPKAIDIWTKIQPKLVSLWQALKDFGSKLLPDLGTLVKGIFSFDGNMIKEGAAGIGETISSMFSSIVDRVKAFLSTKNISLDGIAETAKSIAANIKSIITSIFETIKSIFTGGQSGSGVTTVESKRVAQTVSNEAQVFEGPMNDVQEFTGSATSVLDDISDNIGLMAEKVQAITPSTWEQIKTAVTTALEFVKTIANIYATFQVGGALGAVKSVGGSFKLIAEGLGGFFGSISGTVAETGKSVGNAAENINTLATSLSADNWAQLRGIFKEKNTIKQGRSFLENVRDLMIAFAALAVVVVILGSVPKNILEAGLVAAAQLAAGVVIFVAALGAMTTIFKNVGTQMLNIGKGMLTLAIGLIVFAGAIALFSIMPWTMIGKGLLVIAGALVVLGIFAKITDGANLSKVGFGVLAVAIAVLILTRAVKKFGKMDWTTIGKGLVGVVVLLLAVAVAVRIASTDKAIHGAAAIIAIAIAINLLTLAVMALGKMKFGDLMQGLLAIGIIIAAIDVTLVVLSKTGSKGSMFMAILPIIIMLAAIVIALNKIPSDVGYEKMLALAALIGVLDIVILTLGGKNTSWAAGAKAAANLLEFFGVFVLALAAIGGIDRLLIEAGSPVTLHGLISDSIPTLEAVGDAIGGLVGHIKGSYDAAQIETAGAAIKAFYTDFVPPDEATKQGITEAVGLLSELETNLPDKTTKTTTWFGPDSPFTKQEVLTENGDWHTISDGLVEFGMAMAAFSVIAQGINITGLSKGTAAGAQLNSLLTALPDSGLTVSTKMGWFTSSLLTTGGKSWSTISTGLADFGAAMVSFGDSSGNLNIKNVTKGVTAGTVLNNLLKALPETTATKMTWFTQEYEGGAKSWTTISTGLVDFAKAMTGFANETPNINMFYFWKGVTAASALTALLNALPQDTSKVTTWFGTETRTGPSWDDLSDDLPKFGKAMVNFSAELTKGEIDTEKIKSVAGAGEALATLKGKIPPTSDFKNAVTVQGQTSWSTLSTGLADFAGAMVSVSKAITDEDGNYNINNTAVNDMVTVAGDLVTLQHRIPKTDGLWEKLAGWSQWDTASSGLPQFAQALAQFATEVDGVTVPDNYQSILAVASDLNDIFNEIPPSDGVVQWFFGDIDIVKFAGGIEALGPALKSFSTNVVGITDNVSVDDIAKMLKSIASVYEQFYHMFQLTGNANAPANAIEQIFASTAISGVLDKSESINSFASALDNLRHIMFVDQYEDASFFDFTKLADISTMFDEIDLTPTDEQKTAFQEKLTSAFGTIFDGTRVTAWLSTDVGNEMKAGVGLFWYTTGTKLKDGASSEATRTTLSGAACDIAAYLLLEIQRFSNGLVPTTALSMVTELSNQILANKSIVETSGRDISGWLSSTIDSTAPFQLVTSGVRAMEGLIQGLQSRRAFVVATAVSIARATVESINRTFDIHSPSRVLSRTGTYAILGLANGIKNTGLLAVNNASDVAYDTVSVMQSIIGRATVMMSDDSVPTITPVVDMSNVQRGATAINRTFNGMNFVAGVGLQNAAAIRADHSRQADSAMTNVSNNASVVDAITGIRERIDNLDSSIRNMKILLDGKTLVGGISNTIDTTLARKTVHAMRRN